MKTLYALFVIIIFVCCSCTPVETNHQIDVSYITDKIEQPANQFFEASYTINVKTLHYNPLTKNIPLVKNYTAQVETRMYKVCDKRIFDYLHTNYTMPSYFKYADLLYW
jgi:hypothetical protein